MDQRGKNIVILCDGTNNVWEPGPCKTNVVKLSECLQIDKPERQIRYYDPGVGTAEGNLSEAGGVGLKDRIRRAVGLAWGDGVWENVSDAYQFLMQHYQPNDQIFLFGFSRGAFTVRAVAGMVNLCGLLRPWHVNMLPSLIEVYRSGTTTPAQQKSRIEAGKDFRKNFTDYPDGPNIHFIGVWDTVESVGLGQLVFDTRITSDPSVKPIYKHVRHAVALDELRWPYTPRLYTGQNGHSSAERSYKQVWFCGSHCDVGGSEKEAGLSNAALHWMVREAYERGLLVDFTALNDYDVDPFDLQHDETAALPLWTIAWTFRRQYENQGMLIHESVQERMHHKSGAYRPPLPPHYDVEKTLTSVKHPDGSVETLEPVPRANKGLSPTKVGVKTWHWIWLALSGSATWLVSANADQNSLELVKLQLKDGWTGQLGQRLANWPAASDVTRLIEYDFLFIATYATLIPILIFFALRFENPAGYPAGSTAKWLGFCGGWLPVVDVVENLLTLWAMGWWKADVCTTWSCTSLGWLVSFATSAASLTKFVLLAGFLSALLLAFARGSICAINAAAIWPLRQRRLD
jgi:Uncharacterized alpha/beta hydrolase domain (DUF2235)